MRIGSRKTLAMMLLPLAIVTVSLLIVGRRAAQERRAKATAELVWLAGPQDGYMYALKGRADRQQRVAQLLALGADPDVRVKNCPLIIYAAINMQWDLVKWLVENGADVNAATAEGNTILIEVAGSDTDGSFVQYLLEHGANADQTNRHRESALFYLGLNLRTFMPPDARSVDQLVKAGARADRENEDGDTPLLCYTQSLLGATSVERKNALKQIMRQLLAHGANPLHKNRMGTTPLDMLRKFVAANPQEAQARSVLEAMKVR